jgi:hypothetical protein
MEKGERAVILELSLTQLSLVRQMAEAWRVHLETVMAHARRRGNITVMHNTEMDLVALGMLLDQIAMALGRKPPPAAEKLTLKAPATVTGRITDV